MSTPRERQTDDRQQMKPHQPEPSEGWKHRPVSARPKGSFLFTSSNEGRNCSKAPESRPTLNSCFSFNLSTFYSTKFKVRMANIVLFPYFVTSWGYVSSVMFPWAIILPFHKIWLMQYLVLINGLDNVIWSNKVFLSFHHLMGRISLPWVFKFQLLTNK